MKKRYFFVVIILLIIGFAAVATTLYINGTIRIVADSEDFDVYFSEAILDNKDISETAISTNGKNITYEAGKLSNLGQTTTLDFEVTNNSSQYDAVVSLSCEVNDGLSEYVRLDSSMVNEIIRAKTREKGNVRLTLIKTSPEDINVKIDCEIVANAEGRDNVVEDYEDVEEGESKTYSLYGYFVTEEEIAIPNANLVFYSNEAKYITTDNQGYLYLEGLKSGSHEAYYLENKDPEEIKLLTKEEIESQATTKMEFTTSSRNLVFEKEYKIIDYVIERTRERE